MPVDHHDPNNHTHRKLQSLHTMPYSLRHKFDAKDYTAQYQVVINTLRLRQNCCHFAEDIFKCIFLNENVWISFKISVKIVPKGLVNNIPALLQIMAWRWPGGKPLSEPIILCMYPANERWCYILMWSLIGWTHTHTKWSLSKPAWYVTNEPCWIL